MTRKDLKFAIPLQKQAHVSAELHVHLFELSVQGLLLSPIVLTPHLLRALCRCLPHTCKWKRAIDGHAQIPEGRYARNGCLLSWVGQAICSDSSGPESGTSKVATPKHISAFPEHVFMIFVF